MTRYVWNTLFQFGLLAVTVGMVLLHETGWAIFFAVLLVLSAMS